METFHVLCLCVIYEQLYRPTDTNNFRTFVMFMMRLAIIQSLMNPTKNNRISSAICGMDDSMPLLPIGTSRISFKYFGKYVSVT